MPLGTLDRTPPPFFRQGPSAVTKLAVCAALALFLMVADARFTVVAPLRTAVATALLPLQRALMVPVELMRGGGGYLQGLQQAQAEAAEARRAQALLSQQAARADELARENQALRELLALAPARVPRQRAAEVLFESPDPYSRKLVIDRGQAQGLRPGSAVISPDGVLGQVTRLYPLSAEVTLLSDRDAAIPVLNLRTGQRAAAFGGVRGEGDATMELRFVAANVDIAEGDRLQTSGLDGIYPSGLAVATVRRVERRAEGGFARVLLAPAAPGDGVRHVLVIDPLEGATAAAPAASAAASAGSPQETAR
ncbi:rod shape-determining protein MreC [Rubrivivax albus]|uniref:Cell shape-determining protein MreC n=1 Tax=Rubrivivax albus TaxID=2499835 RepID=A0A437JYF0_9BURK|nr:rod shape-determining protein MreC [Rubrivivax albus]RVT52669.1 rod shape-determining protein MreC [Rubrivivax albus]